MLSNKEEGPVPGRKVSSVLLPGSVPLTFSIAESNSAPLAKMQVYRACL